MTLQQDTDIVTLLRLHDADDTPEQELMSQAADEIERLRSVLDQIAVAIGYSCAAGVPPPQRTHSHDR